MASKAKAAGGKATASRDAGGDKKPNAL
jgi:upstream activation factor subunit UAF30